MVTIALRLILRREEFPDEMIEEFTNANKLRNKIIHKANMDVSKDDAEKAFKTVSKTESITFQSLTSIIDNYYWAIRVM